MIKFNYEDNTYNIIITRKKIKNTYIRVDDNNILVTTNTLATDKYVLDLVSKNIKNIIKMINKKSNYNKENYYLGKKYNIIYGTSDFNIIDDYIYIKENKTIDDFYNIQIKILYNQKLKELYDKFEEKIPFPKLKVRKMKTRWGVCNKSNKTITLNYNLIYYDISCLEYVIIHELSHLVYFDHSKQFWSLVSKYCKDYKKIKQSLKE